MSSDSRLADAAPVVIEAVNLGKRYHIYDKPHYRLLQGMFRGRRNYFREFWALRGMDLSIRRGESVGIIGRNGSGKSTLLQMICGILPPTEGEVRVQGRVAALLELGAGFNPEFSGRDNVYLKASLLGLSHAEIDRRYDDILAFAEIGAFIDQPVKTYSSGMFMRLAFAVSVCSSPDILIVDEALGVGDAYFQNKCKKRIAEIREDGCTLLFVTHSVDALSQLCDRGIVLDQGSKIFDGEVRPAMATYLKLVFGNAARPERKRAAQAASVRATAGTDAKSQLLQSGEHDLFDTRPGYNHDEIRVGNRKATVADIAFEGQSSAPVFAPGQDIDLSLRFVFHENLSRLIFGAQIRDADGHLVYSSNSFFQSGRLHEAEGGEIRIGHFILRGILLPGRYLLTVGLAHYDEAGTQVVALDRRHDAIWITVAASGSGKANGIADMRLQFELVEAPDAH